MISKDYRAPVNAYDIIYYSCNDLGKSASHNCTITPKELINLELS